MTNAAFVVERALIWLTFRIVFALGSLQRQKNYDKMLTMAILSFLLNYV